MICSKHNGNNGMNDNFLFGSKKQFQCPSVANCSRETEATAAAAAAATTTTKFPITLNRECQPPRSI